MNTTQLIEQWAIDRNLHTADPNKQYDKLIEEFGELITGINKNNKEMVIDSIGDMYVVIVILMKQIKGYMDTAIKLSQYYDGKATTLEYMDSLTWLGKELKEFTEGQNELFSSVQTKVTLVLELLIETAKQWGTTLEDCAKTAYEEIKDRKGKLIDGKFVKEADL